MVQKIEDEASTLLRNQRTRISWLADFAIKRYIRNHDIFHFYTFWHKAFLMFFDYWTVFLILSKLLWRNDIYCNLFQSGERGFWRGIVRALDQIIRHPIGFGQILWRSTEEIRNHQV